MISQNGTMVPSDSSSRMSWDGGGGGPTKPPPRPQFPAGLRVLVVDDDPICLRITEQMLKNCRYEVTTCNRAIGALKILRGKKYGFDLVLSDLHMPDMDGFKLLEHVGLEMDLPVIKAVPKKILELMNVSWLTRENVASHLQFTQCWLAQRIERRLSGSFFSGSVGRTMEFQ